MVERDNQSEQVTIVHSNGQSMSVHVPIGLNQVYTESFNSADFLLEDEMKQALSYIPEQEPLIMKLDLVNNSLPNPAPAVGKTQSCSERRRMKFHVKLGTRYGSQVGSFFEERPELTFTQLTTEIGNVEIEQEVAISPTHPSKRVRLGSEELEGGEAQQ